MKPQLTARLLQLLVMKNKDRGFTLIELLVVLIIISILSLIAFPSFLNKSQKVKESEAAQNSATVNKAQIIYVTENNSFAYNFDSLALGSLKGNTGIDSNSSKYYIYRITLAGSGNIIQTAAILSEFKDPNLKPFAAGVSKYVNSANLVVTREIVCKAFKTGAQLASVQPVIGDIAPQNTNPTAQCVNPDYQPL